jgi:hypothetical protein
MRPPRVKRFLKLRAIRLGRCLPRLGLVAVACALGGCAGVAASAPPGREVAGPVVQAHTLPGDRLLAGPVLLEHRAVWVEAGHRLLVRSLDAHGRTRTLFSTSKTPGAPKGALWPFSVRSIAAGDGRVAFIESVVPCASAPPHTQCSAAGTESGPTYSVTLFAGPPGAIRPVESLVPPSPDCHGPPEPAAVAVASDRLVVYELSYPAPGCRSLTRLALRSFSGRLLRVLGNKVAAVSQFLAAGDWAALYKPAQVVGKQDELQIIRVSNGQIVRRLRPRPPSEEIKAFALDSSGTFAFMTDPRRGPCGLRLDSDVLSVGQIGQPGLQVLTREALGEELTTTVLSLAGGQAAYAQPTGSCAPASQIVVASPGEPPTPIPGLEPGTPLVFDGSVIATAHHDIVQLATLRRP